MPSYIQYFLLTFRAKRKRVATLTSTFIHRAYFEISSVKHLFIISPLTYFSVICLSFLPTSQKCNVLYVVSFNLDNSLPSVPINGSLTAFYIKPQSLQFKQLVTCLRHSTRNTPFVLPNIRTQQDSHRVVQCFKKNMFSRIAISVQPSKSLFLVISQPNIA